MTPRVDTTYIFTMIHLQLSVPRRNAKSIIPFITTHSPNRLSVVLLVLFAMQGAASVTFVMAANASLSAASTIPRVVIVGGGLAGLSAAVEAAATGLASVVLVEKEPRIGGNSAKATSGMNSVYSEIQKKMGINDSYEAFESDTIKSGGSFSNPALVNILARSSLSALEFLGEKGIHLNAVSHCGGHTFARTHREGPRADGKPAPVGFDIIRTLQTHIDTNLKSSNEAPGKVQILTGVRVTDLLRGEGGIAGIRGSKGDESVEIAADAVVLATGGYASDFSGEGAMIPKYAPGVTGLATTNGAWATGDGVKMAVRDAGAGTVDLDKVQVHPTGFVDPKDPENKVKFLAPESLRAYGGVLLNPRTVSRFTNELSTRDVVSAAIFSHCADAHHTALLLVPDSSGLDKASLGFYVFKGLMRTYEDEDDVLAKAAEGENVDIGKLRDQIARLNSDDEEEQTRLGTRVVKVDYPGKGGKYYACLVTPAVHYTMGGLRANENTQILTEELVPVSGLFGAGEVTGGVHGANRLAGNSLLECVVFGRIAGQKAAEFAENSFTQRQLHVQT
ncbi:putative NADH-dependent fumarate reductase [Cladochytrium replicatum]|nr:putative NADH-dependent fumarate reductase [Cladochytrium replicatum]